MRLAASLAAALSLTVLAAPGAVSSQADDYYYGARGWIAHTRPQTLNTGAQYCSLMHGAQRPLTQIQYMAEWANLIVAEDAFAGHPADARATLRFPGGRAFTVGTVQLNSGGIMIRLSTQNMDTIMGLLAEPGDFTVTLGDHTHTVPAPADTAFVTILNQCRRAIER